MMNTPLKYIMTLGVMAAMLAACGKKENPSTPHDSTAAPQDTAQAFEDSGEFDQDTNEQPYTYFNIDSLRQVIDAGKHRIDQQMSDPAKVRGFINTLRGSDPASIAYAMHYIRYHPAPAGSAVYDTLYKQFKSLYYLVAVAYSDAVGGPTLQPILQRPANDPERKNLTDYLNLYALQVHVKDGVYYTDADPGLYYNLFRTKASPPLLYYLYQQEKDLSEGFYLEGGMAISFPQLYLRIEAWGLFIDAHPDFLLTPNAVGNYRAYLNALFTGSDNSPVFHKENQLLNPEIKTLYESIMANGQDRVSKKIITDYYNFLAKNNFKRTDEVNTFLDQYNIQLLFKQPV